MTEVNYTAEMEAVIRAALPVSFETVGELSEKLGRKPKSVIAKIKRMEAEERQKMGDDSILFYKARPAYVTKRGEKPITKAEMVKAIAATLDVDVASIESLDKASKAALKVLQDAVSNKGAHLADIELEMSKETE